MCMLAQPRWLRYAEKTLVRRLLEEQRIRESPLIQEIVQEQVQRLVQERLQQEVARQRLELEQWVQTELERVQQRTKQSRAEGEVQAAVHIAERISRQRFGMVPAGLAERLRGLEHDEREMAIARLAISSSLEEWLRSLG